MKTILFVLLLFAFIQEVVYPIQLSGLVGLTVQNIVVYSSVLVLLITEVATGRIFGRKIFGLFGLSLILIGVTINFAYHRMLGEVAMAIPLLEHARYAKSMAFDPVVLYILPFLLIDYKAQGRRYLIILTSVIGLLNVISLLSNFLGFQLFDMHEHYLDRDRLAGITGNPNKTAYMLCMLMPIQYYFFKTPELGLARWLLLVLIALEIVFVLLSGSRGGLITLVLALGVAFIVYRDYRMMVLAAFSIPIAMIFLFQQSLYFQETLERVGVLLSGDLDAASANRFKIWTALLKDFMDTPMATIFGTGFGSAINLGVGARAHSLYIQILVEFGIPGLLVWLGLIWSFISKARRIVTPGDDHFRAMALTSVLVILFAWAFTTLIGVLDLVGVSMGVIFAYFMQLAQAAAAPADPRLRRTNIAHKGPSQMRKQRT